ncbi:MAG: hypothetical protein Q7S35_00170, partial [Candidatus Limnocylindrales bacterium]|nr:hypothetical protein [Candidatus Limnocylindrales bacterium]
MIARVALRRHAIGGFLLSAALIQMAAIGEANAADPPGPGPLDRPIADLALIDAGAGPDAPPMLLTLDTEELPPGTVRAALLDRSAGWQPAGSEIVSLFEPTDGAETPWLIELGRRRFVIVATSHEQERTTLVPIRVAPRGAATLEIGRATTIAAAVDD